MKASNPRHGFTLIELLVVIAVIALLIGLLLPALAKARESSRLCVCVSNQRQAAMAVQVYADQYREMPMLSIDAPAFTIEDSGEDWAQTTEIFTCPSLKRASPGTVFRYGPDELMTQWINGGASSLSSMGWATMRYYEEHPAAWIWIEPLPVHGGMHCATRFDGTHAVTAEATICP